jgi:hypothetical protein
MNMTFFHKNKRVFYRNWNLFHQPIELINEKWLFKYKFQFKIKQKTNKDKTMNSSNISNSSDNNFEHFVDNLSSYIKTFITITGSVALLICIIIFSSIIRTEQTRHKMFHYLLMKSICDFCYYFIYLVDIFIFCPSCHLVKNYYFLEIFDKYTVHFLKQIIGNCTVFFEIFATIDCFILIKNKYTFLLSKKTFLIASLLNIVIFSCIFIPKLFLYTIVQISPDEYEAVRTPFYNSLFFKILSFFYSFIRDILCSVLLILFNILIFLEIKKITKQKERILQSDESKAIAFKAKSKKFKMILYTAISYVIIHTIAAIKTTYGKFQTFNKFWYCLNAFEGNGILLSYLIPFFLYIHFNNIFRRRLFSLFRFRL